MAETAATPDMQAPAAPAPFDKTEAVARFRAFDAAVEAESARPAPQDAEELRDRLAALIDKLPQRPAIRDEHARRWLEKVIPMAFQRMELEHGENGATLGNVFEHAFWHIRRASGIGGSEASTVVKHYRGQRGTWGDANTLVKEKLLILAPQPSTKEMARGVRAEPWIQKIFQSQEALKSDDVALAKLRGFRSDRIPANIGTPDDLVVPVDMPSPRELVDYKAPSAQVMEDYDRDGISFDYVCQDHHYALIAMAAGVKIDRMSIRALDPRSFEIAEFEVPFDPELAREIANTSNRLWLENVMTGVVPDAPRPDELPVEDRDLLLIATQQAALKVLEDEVKKRQTDLRSRIVAVSEVWHDKATGKMDLGIGSWSRDRAWDEDALAGLAEAADIDPAPFYKLTKPKKPEIDSEKAVGILRELNKALIDDKSQEVEAILADLRQEMPLKMKLDADALAARLEELGHSTVPAAQVKESLRISAKKTGPEFERVSALRAEVSQLADGIENIFREKAPEILAGGAPEEEPDLSDEDLGL